MAVEPKPLDIALDIGGTLRGERIFITGATGFIGKALVEKLLWSVPEVGRLVLLVRPHAGRSAAQRLREEILDSPIMSRLRALHVDGWERWIEEKVEVVEGDLARDRFGLDPASYAALAAGVDRVVAAAATVTFDERLDRALELNARGALRVLELARDAGRAPLLHVSTCFVSGRMRGSVAERVLEARDGGAGGADLGATMRLLEDASARAAVPENPERAQVEAGIELAARHGFHDVYTLTKALAERLIERDRGSLPVAIVRPAIVGSAAKEPIPGWIDAVRVTDPMLVAYGRGRTREFPGRPEAKLELVPVDFVVNTMIAGLAALQRDNAATRPNETPNQAPNETRVYQVASGANPISLGELVTYARDGFSRAPLRDSAGEPIPVPKPRFVAPASYRRRLRARRQRAQRLGRWLGRTRFGSRAVAATRTLEHFERLFEVYRPYLDHGARYEDKQTQQLRERLSRSDRAAFPFDISALDWASYIAEVHIPGLRRFALRAESGEPAPPRESDPIADGHARGEFPAARASTLFELFATAAESDPDTMAFQICRDGRWLRYTYGQALTTISNLASRLARRYGIERGDRVVLWGRACPEWVLMSFAVHRLGAVTVPLDPQWPADEIEDAARFTGARLICAAPELAATLSDPGCPVVDLAAPFVPQPDVGLLPGATEIVEVRDPAGLATILFTSGTTVAPRAVPLTHDNLLANVRDLVPVMQSSRERLLSVLPIHHVFEFTVGLLVPIVGGGTISYVAELKPAEINWMMSVTRPTMLVAVPRLLELLHNGIRQSVAAGGPALRLMFRLLFALSALTNGRLGCRLFGKVHSRFGGSLRRIATGGSALEASLGRSFQLMGFQVAEGYGMTETSPVLTVNPWSAIRFGSVGRPLPGVEVELRPPATAPSLNGANGDSSEAGEIWVRGANVMSGYYGSPDASREVLRDGWLNTGDLGSFDADGYLRISGRSKDVIVSDAGKNVFPEEVERRYRDLPEVEELVVVGLPNNGRGECVGAVVVPRSGASELDLETIRDAIAARGSEVPSYQQISRVEIWRGELPKTTTLKVKRGLLREALLAGEAPASTNGAGAPPAAASSAANSGKARDFGSTADEGWVVATLARLTRARAEAVRHSDRLVELGVDSLTKVELVAEIEGRFGLQIDDEAAGAMSCVRDVVAILESRPSAEVNQQR